MSDMNSTESVQRRTTDGAQRDLTHRVRVRTGCLVCRARKVKCDEQRPSCLRCTKIKRKCVYKVSTSALPLLKPAPPKVTDRLHQHNVHNVHSVSRRHTVNGEHTNQTPPISPECTTNTGDSGDLSSEDTIEPSPSFTATDTDLIPDSSQWTLRSRVTGSGAGSQQLAHHDINSFHHGAESGAGSPSARFYTTSLQMRVTTTLDWLGASGLSTRSLSYFIEEVDSPALSAFDFSNWKRIKVHITELAANDQTIAGAILVVQTLHRAQINRLSMLQATAEHKAAIATFENMIADETINFDVVLIMSLILCICEGILPNEDTPSFCAFSQQFEKRLTVWLLSSNRSFVSLRIGAWLQILHVATKRSGCCGLLPETAFDLLSIHITEVPNSQFSNCSDSASAMYDVVSAPLFAFHLELQRISNQIQDLSHYRRSRITPADQEEVSGIVTTLKNRLSALWSSRPPPLRFRSSQLRENFSKTIAEPLVALAGVCTASYFGEVIGLRRTLGDDPFPSIESEQAMDEIRIIIKEKCEGPSSGGLSPGYIRPLFLYAIETLKEDETQWAVFRLKEVRSPTSRSEFIASLAESLGKAQRMEKRRVATKYFCINVFDVMVPCM
jgi:Fungal Zn(2)-Cys(6) binuclear cluster domain